MFLAPTIQPRLAATAAGGLQIGGRPSGLQVGSTRGLSLGTAATGLGMFLYFYHSDILSPYLPMPISHCSI